MSRSVTPPCLSFSSSFVTSFLHHLFPLRPPVNLPLSAPPPGDLAHPFLPPPSSSLSPCGGSRIYISIHRLASRQRRERMAPCQHHELPWRSRAETAPVCWPLHHRERWEREEKKQEEKGGRRQKNTAELGGGGGRDGTSSLQMKNTRLTPGQISTPRWSRRTSPST